MLGVGVIGICFSVIHSTCLGDVEHASIHVLNHFSVMMMIHTKLLK